MRRFGIRRKDLIVCYDQLTSTPYSMSSAARLAWTLRYFGAENVKVLNGGLGKWVNEGRIVGSGPEEEAIEIEKGDYEFNIHNHE